MTGNITSAPLLCCETARAVSVLHVTYRTVSVYFNSRETRFYKGCGGVGKEAVEPLPDKKNEKNSKWGLTTLL